MPVLSNQRHEQVAQLAAQGIDGTHAYLTVYPDAKPDSARAAAARLLATVSVEARVRELQQRVADKAEASAIDLLNRLWEIGSSSEKDRVPALSAMRSFYQEFRESAQVDARSLTFVLPDSTSLEDLKRLRSELA